MSDEQRTGMEPDEAYRPGRAKDSAPDKPGGDDTEGHLARGRGGAIEPSPDEPGGEDTEGHGGKCWPVKDEAPDEPGGDDTEGHSLRGKAKDEAPDELQQGTDEPGADEAGRIRP
ncbi:hypothetical protein BH23CHL7_BH23CHL7_05050 [soil metagenome]